MVSKFQRMVYDQLPSVFDRKQLMGLASELNINLNSALSYIHSWTLKGFITKVEKGQYKKLKSYDTKNIITISKEKDDAPAKMSIPEESILTPAEEDVVLNGFSVKSASDEELLKELVSRGYSWGNMQKIVITHVPYDQFVQ